MFVSSPISQIVLALSTQFREDKDSIKCLELIEEISTNSPDTNSDSFNEKLQSFLQEINRNNNNLIFYTSSFVAYYFEQRDHDELFELFTILMSDYVGYQEKISDYHAGYLCGIFSTALMSDLGLNDKDNIPQDIKEAINYIESENYIVHLEKNVR